MKDRCLRGWLLYDWANSAFATVIMAALLPVYFAEAVVPAGGAQWWGVNWSATSLWGYASGLAALLVFLAAPLLGALADSASSRRRWLLWFMLPGSLLTMLLLSALPGRVAWTLGLYLVASICFVGANIFYDSFLPFLAPPEKRDSLSARGFAWGYLGGGLLLLLDLILIEFHGTLGIGRGLAVRLALASAGLWWGGFGLLAWSWLREPPGSDRPSNLLRDATRRLLATLRESLGRRDVLLFLLAYFFYNDGIQTVVKMASIYGKEELGLATGSLLGALLLVQVVAIPGALLLARLAGRIGARKAIIASLLVWLAVVIWSSRMTTALEFWLLGGVVGLCLGGTQALSRSYFTRFIPRGRSAEYYGFYSVFAKLSAVAGPILFALIRQITGTARLSILALSVFFVIGVLFLLMVRERPEIQRRA